MPKPLPVEVPSFAACRPVGCAALYGHPGQRPGCHGGVPMGPPVRWMFLGKIPSMMVREMVGRWYPQFLVGWMLDNWG